MTVRVGVRRKQTQVLKMNIRTARQSIEKLEAKGRTSDADRLRSLIAESVQELERRGEKA